MYSSIATAETEQESVCARASFHLNSKHLTDNTTQIRTIFLAAFALTVFTLSERVNQIIRRSMKSSGTNWNNWAIFFLLLEWIHKKVAVRCSKQIWLLGSLPSALRHHGTPPPARSWFPRPGNRHLGFHRARAGCECDNPQRSLIRSVNMLKPRANSATCFKSTTGCKLVPTYLMCDVSQC